MTVAMCGGYVLLQRRNGDMRYDWSFFFPGASIASAGGAYPQIYLGMFSFWDELNAVVTGVPSPYIDMTSQAILSNLVIVWTVCIALVYLNSRFSQEHYIGCLLVVISGFVSVTVQLQTGTGLGEYKTASGTMESTSPLWYLIYIVGTIPAGISNCYKQKCLKGVDLEVMYACLWSGWWQILWGILMFPMNWIRLPTPAVYNAPGNTVNYLHDTFTCFFGTAPNPNNIQDMACEAAGGSAAVWFVMYLLFNVSSPEPGGRAWRGRVFASSSRPGTRPLSPRALTPPPRFPPQVTFNVLLLWLTKRMSATWAAIGTVLCLDLTCIFSMSKVLMGNEATPVTFEQYLGLILAGVAMWVYNLAPERDAEGRLIEGADGDDNEKSVSQRQPSFASDRSSMFESLSERSERASSMSFRLSTNSSTSSLGALARAEGDVTVDVASPLQTQRHNSTDM